jgi:hypothetical protein
VTSDNVSAVVAGIAAEFEGWERYRGKAGEMGRVVGVFCGQSVVDVDLMRLCEVLEA